MCGRYERRSDKQRIAEAFQVQAQPDLEELALGPEGEAAPGSLQPVVLLGQDGERRIELMRWGFKLPDRLLFNARAEGIETANFWKGPFADGRVIVPADAVFEWQVLSDKRARKPKFEITVRGRAPFGMAGVWKSWKNPRTEQWENTFAVITGEPNPAMAKIHPRMTRFLAPRDYAEYLVPAERSPVHLLRTLDSDEVCIQRVGTDPITAAQAALFDPQ